MSHSHHTARQGRARREGAEAAHRLRATARREQLECRAVGNGTVALLQELLAPMGQPPSPQPPQRPLLTRRGVPHPHPNSDLVLFYMLFSAAGEDGQRDQELLEHAPQAPAARIEGRRQ
jgi:hypothetical protein